MVVPVSYGEHPHTFYEGEEGAPSARAYSSAEVMKGPSEGSVREVALRSRGGPRDDSAVVVVDFVGRPQLPE